MNDRESFIENTMRIHTNVKAIHYGVNPRIDLLDQDHAKASWAMAYTIWIGDGALMPKGVMRGWGHYYDEYVRTSDGWRISSVTQISQRFEMAEA